MDCSRLQTKGPMAETNNFDGGLFRVNPGRSVDDQGVRACPCASRGELSI